MKTLSIVTITAATALLFAAPSFAAPTLDGRGKLAEEKAVNAQLATVLTQTGADARLAASETPLQLVRHRHHRSHYHHGHHHHGGHYHYYPGHWHRHGNHYDWHPGHYHYHHGRHGYHHRSYYRPGVYYQGRGISIGFGW